MLFATRLDYHQMPAGGDTIFRRRTSYAAGPIGSIRSPQSEIAHSEGYARRVGPDSLLLVRPTLETLLDPAFTADHCFDVEGASDGAFAVTFGPNQDRADVPELQGRFTVGADRHSLQQFEFSYVNVPGAPAALSGSVTFQESLGTANLLITSWRLNGPGSRAEGSELLPAEIGDDTIWRHEPVRLEVHVTDSAGRQAAIGARVALDRMPLTVTTDDTGVASFPQLPIGNHALVIRYGDRETRVAVTLLEPTTRASVDMARVAAQATTTFAGTIRDAKTSRGIPGAEVLLLTSGESVRADSAGGFRIPGVTTAPQLAVVRHVGYALRTIDVTGSVRSDSRVIELQPVPTLDSVVVSARSMAAALSTFEDHRRIGLGHFWTRKDLDEHGANGTLSQVLAQTPGIDTKQMMKGIVASSRHPGGACLSQVYIDQALVFRGRGVPFNLSSLRLEQVEAIEYYAGPAQLPAKYQGLNADCGVIVIWTRRTP